MQIFIPQLANYKLFLQIIIFLTINLSIIFVLLFEAPSAHEHPRSRDNQIKVMALGYLDHLMSHQLNIQTISYFFIINFVTMILFHWWVRNFKINLIIYFQNLLLYYFLRNILSFSFYF